MTSGNPKHNSKKQVYTIKNVRNLYYLRQKLINLLNHNAKGAGRKILTPKQMLQWLPTALAQVKAGNDSESLLNEIRQIVYSLYHSKQITKKV